MKVPRYTAATSTIRTGRRSSISPAARTAARIDLRDLGKVLDHLHGEVPEDRTGLPDPPAN
jgi:hypothetical protein